MSIERGSAYVPVPALQADATLSQANPVSGTKYTVLATASMTRIEGVAAKVTWTVQPTPLEVHGTIDGIDITFGYANPVSATNYYISDFSVNAHNAMNGQGLSGSSATYKNRIEGRSVKIEAETTGGTSQNLTARVKNSKW